MSALLPRSGRIRGLLAIGACVVAAIVGIAATVIMEMRHREIASAQRELRRLDIVLAEQTERSIQGVDLLLQSVIEQMKTTGIDSPDSFREQGTGPDVFSELRRRIAGVPQLDAVTLIAADGDLVNFSRYFPIPHINLADRNYFKTLRRDPGEQFFLSESMENRGTGTLDVYLARRVSGPGGQFLGLVLGAMQVAYFEHLYDELRTDPGTAIVLRRADGAVLAARAPYPVGASVRSLPDGSHILPAAGRDGTAQLVAVRTLVHYPVAIQVSQTLNEALADWRNDATAVGLGGLAAAAAVILLMWALLWQSSAYDTLSHALTARHAAEQARADAEEQLRQAQKMEAVGQLTAGLAHDFNNLLMSILGSLDSPEARQQSDPALARRIAVIRQAAERGASLTRQLLAFSRKQILQPRRVDLNAVLRDTSQLLHGTLSGTIRLTLRLRPDLWPALVDPAQLEHAVLNLVINARDAMPGGGFITIETDNAPLVAADCPEGMSPGAYVRLAVIDAGPGMAPDVLARAVDPFFTTKAQGSGPGSGSGLGLSQVYGFARQSGGGIHIASEPGHGTTVTVFLPRASADVPPAAARTSQSPDLATAPVPEATLLIVDDDTAVRDIVAAILLEAGFTVLQAPDGPAALLQLEAATRIDLLVVDYGMPGMNGMELADIARRRRPDLPVIFMTGHADAAPLQAEKYLLQKPFRAPALISLATTALHRPPLA